MGFKSIKSFLIIFSGFKFLIDTNSIKAGEKITSYTLDGKLENIVLAVVIKATTDGEKNYLSVK